jgi:hypothetical protein
VDNGGVPAEIDTSKPHTARIYVLSEWRPEPGAIPLRAAQVGVNGGVARKP